MQIVIKRKLSKNQVSSIETNAYKMLKIEREMLKVLYSDLKEKKEGLVETTSCYRERIEYKKKELKLKEEKKKKELKLKEEKKEEEEEKK